MGPDPPGRCQRCPISARAEAASVATHEENRADHLLDRTAGARAGVWEAWKDGTLGSGDGAQDVLRRNPYDGLAYGFEELVRSCRPHWSREEVQVFWDTQ